MPQTMTSKEATTYCRPDAFRTVTGRVMIEAIKHFTRYDDMTTIGLPFLCAVGAGLVNTLCAVTVKGAEHHGCSPAKIGVLALTTAGLVSLIVAWPQAGSWLDWHLWMLGVPMGVLSYACIKSMMRANGLGPPSLPWVMANLAMVVPIALSALFIKEPLCWMDGVGLAAFLGMLAAFVLGSLHAEDVGGGNGTAILLLLVAMKLPAVVVFPIVQGVSFLGGIIVTAIIFKEHVNRWKIAGVILGVTVILLSVWRS